MAGETCPVPDTRALRAEPLNIFLLNLHISRTRKLRCTQGTSLTHIHKPSVAEQKLLSGRFSIPSTASLRAIVVQSVQTVLAWWKMSGKGFSLLYRQREM